MTEYREWPYIEAQRILGRLEKLGRSNFTAETGYGPSGLPHIGTFGEVARTSFVLQALKTLAPQVSAHLIAFSDDMDGLREAPRNIPNRDMVKKHLGKPLTAVPDPFGEEPSYAHYMNRKLREFLDSFGFTYEFSSSTGKYRSGAFNDGLKRVLANYGEVKEMFTREIAEDKREAWSPFFPICESCGRIYSTRVTAFDAANSTISYSCEVDAEGKFKSCGHKGTVSALDGGCKVGWKVDWALRWFSLSIDYEMHGEDLTESARLSSRIVRTLGGVPPELFKYELFLDETGKKISKKLGNGISIEQWLRYAPVDSLLYFMYIKPQVSKKMGLPILPEIVDQYLDLVANHDGSADSPVPFVSRLSKGAHAGALHGGKVVTYSMIYELIVALRQDDPAIVRDFLVKYQPEIKGNIEYYDQLIADALIYYREVYLPNVKEEAAGHEMDEVLRAFHGELSKLRDAGGEPDPAAIQTLTFHAAKEREIKPKEWFKTLYRVFLRQSSGPKIGSFIALLGLDKAMERIETHLKG
ncbi:MAG: lysine--tRNA ligase [Nitrospinae bacterium]|nr:lysine--tRNA ligase [Nitrospinota bacterium]